MEIIPHACLKTIIRRWMIIPKQVAMTLCRITTKDSYYTVSEMFEVAACTSVKTSTRFLKYILIAAISLHLK